MLIKVLTKTAVRSHSTGHQVDVGDTERVDDCY